MTTSQSHARSRVARRPVPAAALSKGRAGRRRVPAAVLLPGLLVALVFACTASAATGAMHVSIGEVVRVLGAHLGLAPHSAAPPVDAVVWNVRVPRILLGLVVGSALGVSGAALQGIYRNPLADPGLIGASSGAALGAVATIVLGLGSFGGFTAPVFAFGGSLAASMLTYRLARHDGRTEIVTLVLTGIALNAMVVAFIGFLTFLADDQQLRSIVFWQLGSLAGARWEVLGVATLLVAIGLVSLPRLARQLDLLALGEREARHLGVGVERLRFTVIVLAALVVGASVAVAGIVAFIGLVVPHIVRLVAGPSHRVVLWGSALSGAVLLVLADLFARTVAAPKELPLGVVTSAVGGGFFLWLLLSTRRSQGGWA